jgi:methylenetetrahydrofolate--tRNA-(uracil-5-)-methyltransferase
MRSARSTTWSASRRSCATAPQADIFRMIPGLENAEFARLGGLHRNTYLNSPESPAGPNTALKARSGLRFAGQITGCEGYVESASVGCMAGLFAVMEAKGQDIITPPQTTAMGALLGHITGGHISRDDGAGKPRSFQPMNVNFGLFPLVEAPTKDADGKRIKGKEKSKAKKLAMTQRAKADFAAWQAEIGPVREAAE